MYTFVKSRAPPFDTAEMPFIELFVNRRYRSPRSIAVLEINYDKRKEVCRTGVMTRVDQYALHGQS